MSYLSTNIQKMNYKTNIKENALHGISNGIDIAARIVGKTMGAKGRNIILEEEFEPYKSVTNDGATIVDRMEFSDPLEKMGLSFLKEVVARSNANSGDGSTTTCVLLDAILKEGIKTGVSTLEIKESLDSLLPVIMQHIDDQTKQITEEEVEQVATIAGESAEIGKLLSGIYKRIGKDGIINLEHSGTYDTNYVFIEGVRFSNTGYLSPYMVYEEDKRKNEEKETKAVYHNPTILVTKRKITHINDINPLLEAMQKQGKKDLVIFTDDMDSGVASLLVKAHQDRIINVLIIKAPVIWKDLVFDDFAKITGATIVEDSTGINFKNLEMKHLGTCGKITVDKEETTVIGTADISDHINELKEIGDESSLRRLSWLQTKTAILKLGANSETELSYKRLKVEDAIHSSQSALQNGIVAGGGVCLLNVSALMPHTIGGNILRVAFEAPARQIRANAGAPVCNYLYSGKDVGGFNAATGEEIGNMFEAGIVDSAKVVKQAVRNALGIASTVLTCSDMLAIPPKSQEQIAAEVLTQKGIRPY